MKVLSTVGEAIGSVEAAIVRAVEDLPNVIGSDEVCRESFGRLCEAACGCDCVMVVVVKTDGDEGRS